MLVLCFATNNIHKVEEVSAALGHSFRLTTLMDAGIKEELPETQDTLEGNARQKAQHVFERYGLPCFADDTGLEVVTLAGAPGVHSARYAGPGRRSEDNMALLLRNLEGAKNREAQFRCVIWLATQQGQWSFEGVLPGTILEAPRGDGGFGYDPVFLPSGSNQTLAELSMEEKNKLSHRGIAVRKLVDFLKSR